MRLSIETSMNNISTRRERTENLKSPQTGVTLWWPCVLTQIYASHYPDELKMGKFYIQAPLFPDTLPSQDPADWLNREHCRTWLRHQMETLSALMAWWPVESPGKGQRSGTLVFFYLRLNKRLCRQSRVWWFETLSRWLWRHSTGY